MNATEFVAARMADPTTQWSLGTFGAIAEFARDAGEPAAIDIADTAASAVTARGGIRILLDADDLRLFASESPTRESWTHRVALLLRQGRCAMGRRDVFTELGPDRDALRAADRDAILFDLGLGAVQADVCVRTGDPELAAQLRQCCGRAAFDPASPAMGAILAASPHRVFVSRLGRVEVYQPIPPHDGKSPDGPHTHVLPKLLRLRRSHSATEPSPEGWIPCAHSYPAHPVRDARGDGRAFDDGAHRAFQALLERFGDPALVALKRQVAMAVAAGDDPAATPVANKRFARAGIRVALRQLAAAGKASAALDAWTATHDAAMRNESGDEDDHLAAHHG